MADQKISALTAVTSPVAADVLPIVSGGQTKKVAVSDLAPALGVAWASWTPTWTNLTIGNGVVVAKYYQVGKLIVCRLDLTVGTTTVVTGDITFSLPVTKALFAGPLGSVICLDSSAGAIYPGTINEASTTTVVVRVFNSAGTFAVHTATSPMVPFTWTNPDRLIGQFAYEAA